MNKINDGGPAFPEFKRFEGAYMGKPVYTSSEGGMTLRDYFAAKAMAAMAGNETYTDLLFNNEKRQSSYISVAAYEFADAMLHAREVDK